MNVPDRVYAGDTWEWSETLGDYSADDGYAVSVSFWRARQAAVTASASGLATVWSFTIAATVTAAMIPGEWGWTIYASKGTTRKTAGSGFLRVRPNYAAATSSSAIGTHAEKVLAAIEAVIEKRATKAEGAITINGKAISYYKLDELVRLRDRYVEIVRRERERDGDSMGGASVSRLSRFRFGGA
jgi:hypothetical protein